METEPLVPIVGLINDRFESFLLTVSNAGHTAGSYKVSGRLTIAMATDVLEMRLPTSSFR